MKKSCYTHCCLFMVSLLCFSSITLCQTYKYFQIFDAAHKCYIGAGKSYDGNLYHYRNNDLGDYTQWRFEPASDSGYYYIVDRRHGRAMSSDYEYVVIVPQRPGHILNYNSRNNCKWRAEQATTIGSYWLKDQKYGLAVIAGDEYDGDVYIQNPGERLNAQWVLQLVQAGDIGPAFYVVDQDLLSISLDTSAVNRVEVAPLFAIDQTVNNNTSTDQSTSIEARKTETTTESWEFTKSITVSVAVTVQSGVSVKGVVEVSSTVQTTYEESYSWTNAVEISKETEYLWSIPVNVPAHTSVRVTATIKKYTTHIPFTAVIQSTMGNGTTRIDTIAGTWYGVDYLTGSVDYQDITGILSSNGELPTEYYLSPAYPNPFNPSTNISFSLPERAYVSLKLFDVTGREVAAIVSEQMSAGSHSRTWNAAGMSSGVYFYRLQAGSYVETKKLILLR